MEERASVKTPAAERRPRDWQTNNIGVVSQAVFPDEIQIADKIPSVLIGVLLDLPAHGVQIHRFLDDLT